jgi:hypothetical protein
MADNGIKKIVIQPNSLPVLASNGNYYMRYRVISQTKNTTSVWSPVYELTPNAVSTTTTYTYQSDGSAITITWNIPIDLIDASFDIFARYNTSGTIINESWTYLATTTSNSYTYSIPSAYLFGTAPLSVVQLRIQVASYAKSILDSAKVLQTSSLRTRPSAINGGTPSSQ